MKRFYIIISIIVFFCIWGCEEVMRRKIGGFGGSYPFVESWEINAPEIEVLKAITEIQKEKKRLKSSSFITFLGARDTGYDWNSYPMMNYLEEKKIDSLTPLPEHNNQNSFTDYWQFVNFYYSDTKEVVYAWTRPDVMDSTITTLALVGFSKINDSTDYRLINRDFWYLSNKKQINKFKKTILQPIIEQIEERKQRNKEK
jgi:hypothetical protein